MSVAAAGVAGVGRQEKLRRAVVRILDRGLAVVGTGFLVAPDLVATCAHVVNQALREKGNDLHPAGQEVTITFGAGKPEELVPAVVEGAFFRDEEAEDVALLRLKRPLPGSVAPLALATSEGTEGRELRGFAFPKAGPGGLYMTATVVGPLDDPRAGRRIQLRSTNISPGCSGGPLWDERGRVVGMAVAIVDQEAKTGRHGDTAKAIAAEVLARVCGELSVERVETRTVAQQLEAPPGAERCTAAWLGRQNELAQSDLDTRYTPERHVRTDSERLLDAAALADSFVRQYGRVLRSATETARELLKLPNRTLPSVASDAINRLLEQIATRLPALGTGAPSPSMVLVGETCAEWERAAREVWSAIDAAAVGAGAQLAGTHSGGSASMRPQYEYERLLLHRFFGAIDTLAAFALRFACADSRLVLVMGPAGSGKSHLLANLVDSASAQGQPALLALGEYFLSTDEPWRQLSERLGWEADVGALLFALNEAAGSAGRPALLCIDALNESAERRLWRTHLLAFAGRFEDYPNVRLIVSCRDDFAKLTLPVKLAERREHSWAYVHHDGFGGDIFAAVASYFSGYGVQSQHFPPLLPEFRNPLFLKTFCEAFAGSRLPDGPIALSVVMEARVSKVCERLLRDIDCPEHVTRLAIDVVAELMEKSGGGPVPYGSLRSAVDSVLPGRGESDSLYRHLRSNGLLVEIQHFAAGERCEVMVRFPFERFSEYFVADRMLRPHVSFEELRQAWSHDGTLAGFSEHGAQRANAGLARALAILVPERHGREFLSLFPDAGADRALLSGFLTSLAWRTPQSFGEESQRAVASARRIFPPDAFLELLISVATIPHHPYNGSYLHEYLKAMPLPDRELKWTIPVSGTAAADFIVRWSFRVPPAAVSDEQALLAGRVLLWLCASNHRALRFRATLAAIRLLASRARIVEKLVIDFRGVNDPYVAERVLAIAAGVAMREADRGALHDLAATVFASVFDPDEVPSNVLIRDYARCVLEVARERGALPARIAPEQFRPPYRSKWPRIWPEGRIRAIEERADEWRLITHSVLPESATGYGDFGRYTMQADVEHFSKIRLATQRRSSRAAHGSKTGPADTGRRSRMKQEFDAMVARRWIVQRAAHLGWTPARFAQYDSRLDGGRRPQNIEQSRKERIGKKYQWIALHELLGYLSDHYRLLQRRTEEIAFAGAWQLYARDFDPSQPLRDLDDVECEGEADSHPVTALWSLWWKEKYPDPFADAALCADPLGWVRTPPADFRSLIEWSQLPNRSGEWVILGGHYTWREAEPLGNFRPRPGRLQVWADVRAWLVPRQHLAATLAAVRKIQFWGAYVDRVELGNLWLGQYPWGDEYAAVREYCDQPDRWVRDETMPIVQTIVSCDHGLLPAPRLLSILGARWAGTDLDFVDAEGRTVAFSPLEKGSAPAATLFIHRASLVSAIRAAGWEIIWAVVGDQSCFDRDRHVFVANVEMQFSAVYWLDGNTIAGGLTRTDILPIPR